MGELGSSKTWKLAGLMQADYVHFTGTGYHLKGNLLIEAFKKNVAVFQNMSN
jgi:lysophospholipase L1-like esterase